MNIDAEVLNNITTKQFQQHIKMIIHCDEIGSVPGMLSEFNI